MRPIILAIALIAAPAAVTGGAGEVPVEQTMLHGNGILASRGYFADGRKVGLHETWWPNGVRRSSAFYLADAFHGEYRTWRENGHAYELRHFDHGHESGIQRSWNDDGSLFLNYEVRNGRRYGFINAVPCLPADAEGGCGGSECLTECHTCVTRTFTTWRARQDSNLRPSA